jgi:dGTPase
MPARMRWSEALSGQGGFDHNGHTLRTLIELDGPILAGTGSISPGIRWKGWPSIMARSPHPEWALAEATRSFRSAGRWPSLEAQVAALADDIAYDNHDIDDGLRAGLLSLDQLMEVPMIAEGWRAVEAKFPGVAPSG